MKDSHALLRLATTLLLPLLPSSLIARPPGDQSQQITTGSSDEQKGEDRKLPVKLGTIPALKLIPRPPVIEAESKRIKALIANLAKLDSPDFGLSPTLAGEAFAPIPGQSRTA